MKFVKEPINGQTGPGFPECKCLVRCNSHSINTLGARQNGRHFTDDILKLIFFTANLWISNKISLKYVAYDLFDDIGSDNILAPIKRQAIIWSDDDHRRKCVTRHQWATVEPMWAKTTGRRNIITLRPEQNGRRLADDNFNEFPWMKTFKFPIKFCSLGPNWYKSAIILDDIVV